MTFTEFTAAQWRVIQAARADWPADVDWPAVRLELEQAGRDFWTMRANRRRRPPKAERVRLQRALKHLRALERDLLELEINHSLVELRRTLENRLSLYEAWSSRYFRGPADAHRELLYLRALQQWTGALQGELQFSRADEAAAGPAVRYFSAVMAAVLGDEAPGPAGIAKIIAKERRLREFRKSEWEFRRSRRGHREQSGRRDLD